MVRYPKYGSVAQMELRGPNGYAKYLMEKRGFSCRCIVERKPKEADYIITFPNDGVKYEKTE